MGKKPIKKIIEPSSGAISGAKLKEIWEYRELLYFFVWREIKVRYKHSVLGVLWVIIQPVIAGLIFGIIFGRFVKLPSDGYPYLVFFFCAIIVWSLFANSALKAGEGLLINRNLVTKIYFPRILLPISIVLENTLDFFIYCIVFLAMLFIFKIKLTAHIFYFPIFVFVLLILALGAGFWFSALNVKYRDVRYAIPFLLQIMLYSSPVVYSTAIIPEKWLFLYALNPVVGIIDGFRWVFLGKAATLQITFPVSLLCSFLIFLTGIVYFYRMQKNVADII
ncbi:MAG: ABC transporter permease [Candidatus Omnitrophica bacterium]|nr:ABC transporter permease [Candidatus Omnitrophota bacterium]